jgi:PST family polysaccharide transporter
MRSNTGGLGARTAKGAAWIGAQTLLTKVVASIGQVVLARFYLPAHDFGLIGLATTVTVFTMTIQQTGVRDVLIHRHRAFHCWANAAFWMSLAIGLAAGLATAASGPIAAWAYHQPDLVKFLLVWAAVIPLSALSTVPQARLQADFRFRFLSILGVLESVVLLAATIAFARAGFGPICVAYAQLLVSILRLPPMWLAGGTHVRLRFDWRRWRYLAGDSGLTIAGSLALAVVIQGDYVALGLFRSARDVGYYFFAYNLSIHVHILLSAAFVSVCMSSFSMMRGDSSRQLSAYLLITKLVGSVGVPACLFQAVFAGPIVRTLFGLKWGPAVPLLSLLSIGTAFRIATGPAYSMIKAQGRFKQLFVFSAVYACVFATAVGLAAWLGGSLGVAATVMCMMIVIDPVLILIAIRNSGGPVTEIANVYLAPLLAGGAAVTAAWWVGRFLPGVTGDIPRLMIGAICMTIVYASLLRIVAPSLWLQAVETFSRMVKGRSFVQVPTVAVS